MQINANLSPLQSQGVKNQSGGILDQNAQCKQIITHDQYLDNLIEDQPHTHKMVESMRPGHQPERHDRSKIQQAAYGALNQSLSIAQVQ